LSNQLANLVGKQTYCIGFDGCNLPPIVCDSNPNRLGQESLVNQTERNLMLRVATLDYSATGEGRTLVVLAAHADDLEDFKSWISVTMGDSAEYYLRGVEFYEGFPDTPDSAIEWLVSDQVRKFLKDETDKPRGNVELYLTHHFNFS